MTNIPQKVLIYENLMYRFYSDKTVCYNPRLLNAYPHYGDRKDQPARWTLQHGRLVVHTKLGQADPQSKKDSHDFKHIAYPKVLCDIIMAE